MKKLFTLLLQIITLPLFAQTASQISTTLYAKTGFLFYKTDSSAYFYAPGFALQKESENSVFDCSAEYLKTKSSLQKFNGSLESAKINADYKTKNLQLGISFSPFTAPDKVNILDQKPRFNFENINGLNWNVYSGYSFSPDWQLTARYFSSIANCKKGDFYYFYGKPDNIFMFGGNLQLYAPFKILFNASAFNLNTNIDTNDSVNMGNLKCSYANFIAGKKIDFSSEDSFYIQPAIGYVYLNLKGQLSATNKTQTYALFPFKSVDGFVKDNLHCLILNNDFYFSRNNFSVLLDFYYLWCIANNAQGKYSYQYKKSLFFDGSSGSNEINIPEFSNCHVFLGNLELNYVFDTHSKIKPGIKLEKKIASAIPSQKIKEFFKDKDLFPQDYTTWQKVSMILLSGTSISLSISF